MGTLIHTKDQGLFNCIAAEVNRLAGMMCYYYRLRRDISQRDPLYDEIEEPEFMNMPDGLRMPCFVTNPEHATTTGEEGRRTQWDATLWIARKSWEDGTDATEPPRIGDIVNCWGEWFDVVDYDKDGIMDDQRPVYVLHKLNLRRTTKYEAWRRKEP